MTDATNTLYLLDAMALAYRAHFIFINRPLINSKGFNSSATYGFTSALIKLIEDHSIEHIGVVFDVMEEGGTFRDEMYEDYKGHRDPPPEELLANLPFIKQVVQALDIPVVGFDFLVPDITGPDYVIIEANERPGLANHEPQPTAERFVDLLFPQTIVR